MNGFEVGRGFQEARVLALVERREDALALLDQVLAAVPNHLGALVLRSDVLCALGRPGEALVYAREAVQGWPTAAVAHSALARCLEALGQAPEALQAAQESRRLLAGAEPGEAAVVFATLVGCLRHARLFREALAAALEGHERTGDAILAEWAVEIEQELAAAERERC
ncbi:MAG TPA: tetratricopeptide repeat protein [Vicinamibacteria bacterium]|jgi:tetratricopeptide (TPR) repeat protein